MSQVQDERAPGSEDLFNTEELLQGHEEMPYDAEIATEEPVGSMDFDAEEVAEEPESENQEDDLDEMIEDTEEATDDLEVESSELTEVDAAGAEGTASKPAKKAASTQDKLTELPLSKVKHIIKLDPEVNLVNAEAVYLITKATESFVRSLGKESFNFAAQQKKKTITKSHVDSALQMLPIEL